MRAHEVESGTSLVIHSDEPMYRPPGSPDSENELYLKLFITNGGGW
jgi:hypothetical protein